MVGRIQSLMSCDLLVPVFPQLLLRVALLPAMRSFPQVRSQHGSWLHSERIREERGWPLMEAPGLSLPNFGSDITFALFYLLKVSVGPAHTQRKGPDKH